MTFSARPGAAAEIPRCQTHEGGHPLEMIPVFRRWPRSMTRDIVYTAIWNSLFAVAFTGIAVLFEQRLPLLETFRINMVFAQCIGYAIHGLFMLLDRLLPNMHRRSLLPRVLYYAAVPMVGVFVGYLAAASLLGFAETRLWLFTGRGIVATIILSLVITAVLLAIFLPRERAARAEARFALEQARSAAAEKEMTAAQLQLLEAQIEPHFLYNTLAHVVSLIDTDPATAKGMLDRLIALLRATASAASGPSTLGRQLELLRAYLEIFELRMGPRLSWRIDAPADLAALPIPPMLLQPVVENALKHGLEPKLEGGNVTIAARRAAGTLTLTVVDTGLGIRALRADASGGLGLANLRARLVALYGATARMTVEDNTPSGARVSIALPIGGESAA